MVTLAFVLAGLLALAAFVLLVIDARIAAKNRPDFDDEYEEYEGEEYEAAQLSEPRRSQRPPRTRMPEEVDAAPRSAQLRAQDAEEEAGLRSAAIPWPAVNPDQSAVDYQDNDEPLDVEVEEDLHEVPQVEADELEEASENPEGEPEVGAADLGKPETAKETATEHADLEESPADEDTAANTGRFAALSSSLASGLPGAHRRERRAWAEERGFSFQRGDEYLSEEWNRGVTAGQTQARDVVSGTVDGYEMHLVDLNGSAVMAIRRPTGATGVVVDMHRGLTLEDATRAINGSIDQSGAPRGDETKVLRNFLLSLGGSRGVNSDLVPVDEVAGFGVMANDAGPAQRFLDARVKEALQELPDAVVAVWTESCWVLAEFIRANHREDWEATIAPLSKIADAACTLPPATNAGQAIAAEELYPGRLMAPAGQKPESDAAEQAEELAEEMPKVTRPEEPLDLPTRSTIVSRGVVEPHIVGVDDVEPIAAGEKADLPDDGTRVLRDLSRGSSIFDDLALELGTDPLSDIPMMDDEKEEELADTEAEAEAELDAELADAELADAEVAEAELVAEAAESEVSSAEPVDVEVVDADSDDADNPTDPEEEKN